MTEINRHRLRSSMESETKKFVAERPKSAALFERAQKSLLGGVPMNWMAKWAGAFPPFEAEAQGAELVDVDGHRYVDFCLGDTGAMTGHSPAATVLAAQQQLASGITTMLPNEDAIYVGEELQKRFGLPCWQFALSATDANRFSIRLARHITGRPKILVFNWCYHGTVDETFITLDENGISKPRRGNVGPPVDPSATTKVVEFNDVDALAEALKSGEVACVLAELAMTNVGIVHPEPNFHRHLRDLTRQHGCLLIIDETHTICAGTGGFTRAQNLDPDFLIFGKAIGGGVPGAADAFDRMFPLAESWTAGVQQAIEKFKLPWHVTSLGCRAEYLFSPTAPRNGTEAHAAMDFNLERFMHLFAMNRGILLTPFHNMALMSPATTQKHVDCHTEVFTAALTQLVA